jgi:hypothetical protein
MAEHDHFLHDLSYAAELINDSRPQLADCFIGYETNRYSLSFVMSSRPRGECGWTNQPPRTAEKPQYGKTDESCVGVSENEATNNLDRKNAKTERGKEYLEKGGHIESEIFACRSHDAVGCGKGLGLELQSHRQMEGIQGSQGVIVQTGNQPYGSQGMVIM